MSRGEANQKRNEGPSPENHWILVVERLLGEFGQKRFGFLLRGARFPALFLLQSPSVFFQSSNGTFDSSRQGLQVFQDRISYPHVEVNVSICEIEGIGE